MIIYDEIDDFVLPNEMEFPHGLLARKRISVHSMDNWPDFRPSTPCFRGLFVRLGKAYYAKTKGKQSRMVLVCKKGWDKPTELRSRPLAKVVGYER